jgi:hypothetical protein
VAEEEEVEGVPQDFSSLPYQAFLEGNALKKMNASAAKFWILQS